MNDEQIMLVAVHDLTAILCQVRDVASHARSRDSRRVPVPDAEVLETLAFRGLRYLDNLRVLKRQDPPTENRRQTGSDLIRTLKKTVQSFQQDASSRGLTLDVEIDEQADDANYNLDSRLLTLALGNMVDNALKYSKTDTAVEISGRFPPDGSVELSVLNSSVAPMPNGYDFALGGRGDVGKQYAEGLGIGLWVAKEIVGWHKGTIQVQSSQDDVTKFVIGIPPSEIIS